MRKLLFLCLLLVVGVIGLGYYLGWINFSTSRDPETGKKEFQLTVDQEKFKSDAQKLKERGTNGSGEKKESSQGN